MKKLFSFFKKDRVPYNNISEQLSDKKEKVPWITKKKVFIYEIDESTAAYLNLNNFTTEINNIKYLEMKENHKDLDIDNPNLEIFDDKIDNYIEEYISNEVQIEEIEAPEIIIPEKQEVIIKEPIMVAKESSIKIKDNFPVNVEISTEALVDESENVESMVNPCGHIEEIEEFSNPESDLSEDEDISGMIDIEEIDDDMLDDEPEIMAPETKKNANDQLELPLEERLGKIFDEIKINTKYIIPTSFLNESTPIDTESWQNEITKNSRLLVNTLADFGIESKVVNVNRGPVITLYEMQIAPGIKVNKIVGLADDIAMALAAYRVRIVAPIPGKRAIGVELPNKNREIVTLGDIIRNNLAKESGYLNVGLGKDILGEPVVLDLKRLPHLLIAGATGSGKSVCVNTIITSLIYNYDPNYLRFILVDPKMVELQVYEGLPHLLTPVITEPHIAPMALKWAIQEMERRYKLLSRISVRDLEKYNKKVETIEDDEYESLPYIVIIIDELADLMMVASKEIEGYITRIAQKARAVGIHLVLATQRPSVDIITGIIKANFPARIAFQVAQKTDSRTIIDQNGAEKLLGKGDLLYQSPMSSFPVRIQGAFISEEEILKTVTHLSEMGEPNYIDIETNVFDDEDEANANESGDELFVEALKIIEETRKASASYLQRRLSIGYNRAARIIETMEELGYVGPQQGSKPREVFI